MAEIKTKKNDASPETFLKKVKDAQRQKDAFTILELMKKATKSEPKMWGSAIIGFGDFKYTLSNGKENPWFMIGFSPRAKEFSLYMMGPKDADAPLFKKLGKHSMGKGCLYINKLADVDTKVLLQLMEAHVKYCREETKK